MVVSAFINKIKRYRNQDMTCSSMLFDSIEFEVNCKRKTKLFQLMKRIDLTLNMDDFAQVLEQPAGSGRPGSYSGRSASFKCKVKGLIGHP